MPLGGVLTMTNEAMIAELNEAAVLIDGAREKCHALMQTAESAEHEALCESVWDAFISLDSACTRLRNRLVVSPVLLEALGDSPTMTVEAEYGELEEGLGFADAQFAALVAD